jgi:hypothetical protein
VDNSQWRRLFSAGAFLGLLAAPALAHAATDGYVELQFDTPTVADLIRRELATQSNFCPQSTVDANGNAAYADHLDFTSVGRFSRAETASTVPINRFASVSERAVVYTQPVTVQLKTVACARDPECVTTTPVAATVNYTLNANAASRICLRSNGSAGFPSGVTPPLLNVCLPFGADYAAKVAGVAGTTASGTAVSLSSDGTRLAARIELGKTQADYDKVRLAAWQSFANGALETTGASGNWSVFTHQSLILGALQNRLAPALASQAGFTVKGPVSTSWKALGASGAQISASLNGVFGGSCSNGVAVNDINISGTVGPNTTFSTKGPGMTTGLLANGTISYNVSNSDAALCGLELGGPIGALVYGALANSADILPASFGPNCSIKSDFTFSCNEVTHPQLASVGPLQLATSTLGSVVGSATGLTMNGSVSTAGSAALTMTGQLDPWSYDAKASMYDSGLKVTGTGNLCAPVEFWADNGSGIGLFTITNPSLPGLPAHYSVTLSATNLRTFDANPFHVYATVKTSAGVRTYQLL